MGTDLDLINAIEKWMRSRSYSEATISEMLSSVRALVRMREQNVDKWLASTGARMRPVLARLEVAAQELPENVRDDVKALVDFGRAALPPGRPSPRFGGHVLRRRRRDREARSLEDEAWARLVNAICNEPTPAARVLEVMARTGLRVGDVLRISRSALADARKSGQVTLTLKGRKQVHMRLEGAEDAWGKLIDGVLAARAPDVARWVSPGCKSSIHGAHGPYQAVRRLLQRLSANVGISEEVWTHRLRRTVGVRAYRATKDVLAVRDLLHHESAKTTYSYLSETRSDRVVEILKKIRNDV